MRKTALITGASSGLGIEFARLHALAGDNLVLVARSQDKMEVLKAELEKQFGISVFVISKDLSEPTAPEAIFDEVKRIKLDVDYLINNAGFGDFGLFAESDRRKQMQMINVNIVALTNMTRLFLPDMVQRKSGKILNVASTAAFQPGPTMSVYFATKAYVLSFSEAIANELRGSGVTITALCPGPTETGFKSAASLDGSSMFNGKGVAGSHKVAEFGYRSMMKGRVVAIPGFINVSLAQSVRFVPRKLAAAAARWMLK